mmetsp:Transcript_20118/g.45708  ORF Transcript_20118/g.45708 Transcript_20118/m.45708 type:complete len:283 (+) Transcript_20118:183-1031(+)
MLPVCERATPSKDVMAAPRRRVSARKTARFSSATSARSNWSTMRLLSSMADSVSSWAVSSRPKGSRSPKGISVSTSMPEEACVLISPDCGGAGAGAAAVATASSFSSFSSFSSSPFSAFSSFSLPSSSPSSLASKKRRKGPRASLESGSAACFRASRAAKPGASKVTSSTFPPSRIVLDSTFTSFCLQPVAVAMPCVKSIAKSAGKGAFTFSWTCCKARSSNGRFEVRSCSNSFILLMIIFSEELAALLAGASLWLCKETALAALAFATAVLFCLSWCLWWR